MCVDFDLSVEGMSTNTHTQTFLFHMYTLSMHCVECTYISVSSYSLFCTTPLFSQERKDHREGLWRSVFFATSWRCQKHTNIQSSQQPYSWFFLKRIGSKLCLPVTTFETVDLGPCWVFPSFIWGSFFWSHFHVSLVRWWFLSAVPSKVFPQYWQLRIAGTTFKACANNYQCVVISKSVFNKPGDKVSLAINHG